MPSTVLSFSVSGWSISSGVLMNDPKPSPTSRSACTSVPTMPSSSLSWRPRTSCHEIVVKCAPYTTSSVTSTSVRQGSSVQRVKHPLHSRLLQCSFYILSCIGNILPR